MGHNSWKTEVERIERNRTWALSADMQRDAESLVVEWNRRMEAQVDPQYWPTIGCAVRAGRPFLKLLCPGCNQVSYSDLRKIVRPQDTAVSAIKFYCDSMCRGQAPRPRLMGLFGYVEWTDEGLANCNE